MRAWLGACGILLNPVNGPSVETARRTFGWGRRRGLQSLGAVDLAESAVERAERQVAGLARNFDEEAIREAEGRHVAKLRQRAGYDVRILQREPLVREQHFD